MIERVALLYNPHAGRGKVLKNLPIIESWLNSNFKNWKKFSTLPGDTLRIVMEEVKDFGPQILFIAGGDGTLNQYVNVTQTYFPIYIIPLGTGNDMARIIYKDLSLESVLLSFKNSQIKTHDVGIIEFEGGVRRFVNGLGFGLDAKVVQILPTIKYLSGDLLYLYAVIKVLKNFKGQPFRIKYNGKVIEDEAIITTFGVGKYLGGGFLLHPKANPFDGKLEFSFIKRVSLMKFLTRIPSLMKGTHLKEKEVFYGRGENFEVESDDHLYSQLDGEFLNAGFKAKIGTARGALPIYVPR